MQMTGEYKIMPIFKTQEWSDDLLFYLQGNHLPSGQANLPFYVVVVPTEYGYIYIFTDFTIYRSTSSCIVDIPYRYLHAHSKEI